MRIFFCILLFFWSFGANANINKEKITNLVENYFTGFENLKANFIQESNGQSLRGTLYISKPGKFRWEYNNNKLLIVSTGDTIIYVDNELEEVHYLATKDTAAGFLCEEKLDLRNGEYRIEKISKFKSHIAVLIKNIKRKEAGLINLIFEPKPFLLKSIEVQDFVGNLITIDLGNISYPPSLDSSLFNYYEKHNKSR